MIAVVIVVAIDTAVADAGGGGRLTAGQLDRHSGGSVAGPARLDPGDQHWFALVHQPVECVSAFGPRVAIGARQTTVRRMVEFGVSEPDGAVRQQGHVVAACLGSVVALPARITSGSGSNPFRIGLL